MPAGRNSNRRQGLSRYVYVVSLLSLTLRDSIGTQPGGVTCFIKIACSKGENGSNDVCLTGSTIEAVHLQKQDPCHDSRSLVPVNRWMVLDNGDGVQGGHVNNVDTIGIGIVLTRPGEGRFQ